MAAPAIRTREQADHLYQMLASGQVDPDKAEEAKASLQAFMEAEQAEKKRQATAEQLNKLIDTSPREGVKGLRDRSTGALGLGETDKARLRGEAPLGTPENPDRTYFLNQAAETGVDVQTGLPLSDRGRAALLSFDGDMQQAAMEQLVRRQHTQAGVALPEGTPLIYQDETSGEAYYLRPEGGKLVRTMINPAGMDAGDLIELGPEAFSLGAEVGGAIAGGAAGSAIGGAGAGTAVGGAAGAAGGLFASYEARKKAAKMFGIPEDLVENSEIPFGDLAFAAGGELGGAAIMGTVRWWKNLGRPIDEKDLPRLKAKYEENLAKVKGLEDKLGDDIHLSPTVGELAEDPTLMILEDGLRRQSRGGAAVEAQARDINLKRSQGRAFRELADSNGVRTPMDQEPIEEVSRQVQDRARTPVNAVEQQRTAVQSQADEANDYFDTAPDLQLFRNVRDTAATTSREVKDRSDAAWEAYRREVGFDPTNRRSQYGLSNPENSPIREFMSSVEGNRGQALMQSLERSQQAFLKDTGFVMEEGAEELTGLAQKTLDMRHLHFVLSHLKRQQRAAGRATDPDAYRTEDINGLITAIEKQIQGTPIVRRNGQAVSQEKQARIRLSWDDANDATRQMHEQFDTDNMTKLLETAKRKNPETGKFEDVLVMNPQAVRNSMFRPADTRFLEESLEAIGQTPATKAALAKQLMLKYRDEVFKDGVPQQARHNDFIANYTDHMNVLLGEEATARINNVGDFARQIRQYDAQVRKLETDIQKAYGKRVTDPISSINIAKELLSDRVSPKQARNIMNTVGRFDTDLAEQVRGHFIQQAFHDSVGKNDLVNSRNLGKLLRENADTFDAVVGVQYRRDLEALQDLVRLTDQRSVVKAPGTDVQPWWLQVGRSLFGPLSKKQRFATAANRAFRRLAGHRAANLMAQPDMLRNFVRLGRMTPRDPRFLGLVSTLGIVEFIDEDTMSLAERAAKERSTMLDDMPEVRLGL